ncbi:PhzF family phenazine biosynthesis protein [Lichenicoccus roseus]|uniref:PhzF family phenazine biosynthesis protein n=1 Tax=Lichenicoccus roseus TaxID=2683649 RepID=A0A5R9J858_9PROT|nr:PhzF family phenazine biosynthesis protein [Lichenicoccus roseus]TLU73800.1 PhzF family phenazine biosynthesis protein [Lichenicoccus roseus]
MKFVFRQVDVFTETPLLGNPLAVVHDADALDGATMQAFANWTNLSETTFLLRPTQLAADYRVRIFTPDRELPFAGHPTLGSCHAWLQAGGVPRSDQVVQECGAGLIRIRRDAGRLAFAAPPLLRTGDVEAGLLDRIANALGLARNAIRQAQWIDNGPGWIGLMLATRAELLAVRPDFSLLAGLDIGLVAPWDPEVDGDEAAFEVRGFDRTEDPVTGSLNAGLAQWLIGAGLAPPRYVARQGTVLGRRGVVHVERRDAAIWIGGAVATCIEGHVDLPAAPV